MSARWWTAREASRPGLLLRLFPAPQSVDSTAGVLSLSTQTAPAGRLAAVPDTPAHRSGRGVRTEPARCQRGLARLGKARTVDLRRMLFAGAPWPGAAHRRPFPPPEGEAPPARPRPEPPPFDDLAPRLAALLQPPLEVLLRAGGPLKWPAPFFGYQYDGIRALIDSSRLLLGDDMGLGKTIQAIAALRILLHRREIKRALVVAPAGVVEQWRRELALWAPELRVLQVAGAPRDRWWQWKYRAHVTLTSYETLRADADRPPAWGPRREPWGVVLLDEAQRIKNRDAEVSHACKRLPRQRSWALTGTPLENSTEDVSSILEFVMGVEGRPPASGSLRASLQELQLRRRKDEVLKDLPPKIVTELRLPLTPEQRRAYDRAEREGRVALREGDVAIEHVLALITRLKQICNFAPRSGASAKMLDLQERLRELSEAGHRALVFTQYTSDESGAHRIAQGLRAFDPLVYTGELRAMARSQMIDDFRSHDRHKALILSLKAGGQGLNLQSASYVFHFDRWWNPAVERQAEDRAHRLGQTRPVHVYRYVMADTIEQRIDEVLRSKTDLFRQIVEGASLDLTRLLSRQDLFGLFDLAPPEP